MKKKLTFIKSEILDLSTDIQRKIIGGINHNNFTINIYEPETYDERTNITCGDNNCTTGNDKITLYC